MCTRLTMGIIVVSVMIVALVGPSDAGSKSWKVTALEGPDEVSWAGTVASDVSESGYVGGAWLGSNHRFHAAYWYKGEAYNMATEIGQPKGTSYSNVLSINSAGLMGGNASSEDQSVYVAVLWDVKQGTWTNLHPAGLFENLVYSNVKGVNASGDAVGEIVQSPGDSPYGWLKSAYVWPKDDRDGYALPGTEDYAYSEATGINSSGTISGWGIDPIDLTWHAVLWVKDKNGDYELVDLQAEMFGDTDYTDTAAFDVSEDGTVVGYGWKDYDYSTGPTAFTWTAKDGLVELDLDSETYGIPWKVNGNYVGGGIGTGGQVVGQNVSDDAVVWWKGDLIVAVAEFDDYEYCEASSVTNDGTIVGIGLKYPDPEDVSTSFPMAFIAEK